MRSGTAAWASGAVAAGALVGIWRLRCHGVEVGRFADAAAPALLAVQAIGRVGNYFNQELFGAPTTLPWGLQIDPAHRPPGYLAYATFHPTFLERKLAQFVQVRGVGALILGISISLDELAIGFTLGLLRLPPGLVVILIAVQAFVVAQLGLRLGARLSVGLREGAERLAGVALTGLALVLLAEKLA